MNKAQLFAALFAVLTLAGSGCSGGGYGAILSPPPSYTLDGTVSGLAGSGLVLENNGVGNGFTIGRAANGTYPNLTGDSLANGTAYNVTVKTQATNPSQTCVATNGMGTVAGASITNIAVTCTTNADRFVYVANGGSNNISAYAVNAASGALTAISGSPFPAGNVPYSIAVDPSGKFAYVANQSNGNVSAFAIDGTSGALTAVSGSPFATGPVPFSVAVDPSSKFLYVTNGNSGNVSAYTINPSSGALTAVSGSPFAAGSLPYAVAVGH
jgi:6-phosphogluconolactonase